MRFKTVIALFLLLQIPFFAIAKKQQSIIVTDLRTERLVNPMSVDTPAPRLGWCIESDKNDVMQTSCHIRCDADVLPHPCSFIRRKTRS
jgi:alpha-L-rhamnosidase